MKTVIAGILVFAVYSFFTIRHYVCNVMEFCDETVTVVEEIPPVIVEEDPGNLVFLLNLQQPKINNDFQVLKDSLAAQISRTNAGIIITGEYFENEQNNTDYANLGKARAAEVRKLLMDAGVTDIVAIKGKLIDGSAPEQDTYFKAIDFGTISKKLTVHFPFASASPEIDDELNEALMNFVSVMGDTEMNISVTGHADSKGSEDINYKYGMARAKAIANLLVANDMKESQLTIDSKGESMPIASNDTEEGMQANRRVEIVINK